MIKITEYEIFMKAALEQARNAFDAGEVPVGAVVVKDGKVIASARNCMHENHDPSMHAELLALKAAAKQLGTDKLNGCTLVSTLEPCCMCAGACSHFAVGTVVFGAYDEEYGCCYSALDAFKLMDSPTRCIGGVMETECSTLLDDFFYNLRQKQTEA